MVNKIQKIRAKWRERRRQRLLALIGRDIENIARDAYNDGCYVTHRQEQAKRTLEFARLMQENEALRKHAIDILNVHMPEITIPMAGD